MRAVADGLRIAIVYDCLYPYTAGGGERVYTEMARRLSAQGHRVDYLTRVQWEGGTPDEPFTVVPIWSGEIADATGDRRTAAAAGFAHAVYRELRRRRGDYDLIIVSALPSLNVFAARAATWRAGNWLLADWLEVWPYRKWREYSGLAVGTIAYVLQALGLRRSDDVSVNSAFTLARAQKHLRPGAGVVLGLVDLVGDVKQTGERVDDGMILFAGRHIADKQLTVLPAALALLHRRRPDAHLVVVGSGPETPALVAAAAEAGVELDVRGRVSREELESLFSRAAVLVNPSRREGFGLVVAEAARHGTPSVVVAGDDNASAELIVEGVNGFVAPSNAPEALAEALRKALDAGPSLRESTLGWFERARRTQSLDHSLAVILDRYETFRTR